MSTTKPPDQRGPASPGTDRNTILIFVGGVLLVVLGVVALISTPFVLRDSEAQPPADANASASASAWIGSTQSEPTTPVVTTPEDGAQTGTPADGLAVAVTVISPSSIDVVETVHWPEGGPATIELELPEDAATAGGLAITPQPTVEWLRVSVDGVPVAPTRREGATNSWVVLPPALDPTTMEVRYVLAGAIVRSVPASPGRALAVLTPISSGAAGALPIGLAISAVDVLNVYCPAAANQDAILCGHLDGDRWMVAMPPGRPLVVAQLDLPAPA